MNTKDTILVVDDTPANLKLLASILTDEGYRVLPADSGELALASVAAMPPDLILLDIRMPGMDGLEVYRRLQARAESRAIPIVFVSASVQGAERTEALKLGAVDFIAKPFQREELLARVHTHLELHRLRIKLEQQAANLLRANEQLQTELAERERSTATMSALNQELRNEIAMREQTEAELRDSENKFKCVFENSNVGKSITQPSGELQVNRAFCDLLGYSMTELQSKHWQTVTHPDDVDPTQRVVDALLAGKQDSVRFTKRYLHKNGSVVWADVSTTLRRDPVGQPLYFITTVMDITMRHRAEEALQREKEFGRALLDNLTDGVVACDALGTLVLFNRVAREWHRQDLLALPPGEWGQHYDLYEPDGTTRLPTESIPLVRALRGETIQDAGITIVAKGQPARHILAAGCPFYDDRHNLLGAVVVLHDFTVYKQMENALRESEERFRRAVLNSPFPILLHADDGAIIQASHSWCEITGYTREELATIEDWTERAYGERKALVQADIDTLYGLAGRKYEGDYSVRTKSGNIRIWEFSSAPLGRLTDGRRLVISMALDVTERRHSEEVLCASEIRYRRLFESAKDGILILDAETGMIVDVNPFLIDLLGISYEAIIHKKIVELGFFKDIVANQAKFEELQQSEYVRYDDLPLETADGRRIEVEFVSNVYLIHQQKVIQCNIRDITDRRRLERQHETMEAHMHQQQRLESIGTLAAGVAHEINNPINSAMNYAQLIQDRLPTDSPLVEYTREILHETERVAAIVRNLLQFSRTDKQSHSPACMADVVESTLSLIRSVIRHDQITLAVNVPANLPRLRCRSQQIQQVLMNLMTNARDALNERYPGHDPDKVLNLSANLSEKEGGRWIRVTVEDHGIGITSEVREHMFDPFFTTKPRDKGTGLGLSISHGIVKEHHGELTVESEPGRFTRMHLDLPVDKEANE